MSSDTGSENKSQTRRNLLFNILSLLANAAIGIFYTPFLVRNLGIIAYGVLPLVLIINQYISVLTGSLTSALTRFYSIAIQQDRFSDASRCINTALGVIFIIFIILLLPLSFIIIHVDSIFTIPTELLYKTQILFIFTISGFFISLISSVFNITLYANNRLDSLNIIKIIRITLKFAFIVLLFTCLSSDIVYVGYANLLTEIIVLISSIYIFRNISKDRIRINFRYFDRITLFSMLGMTTWVMIVQIGDTGLYRIDNLIVNIFWTTKESGILGAFSELGTYIMLSLAVISSIFGPLILIAYSKNRHEEVIQMTIDRSLTVGVLSAVIVGLVIGFSSQISKIWLGDEFETFHLWLVLKVILIPFYTASGVFSFVYRAWNRVKVPALITVALGAVNLIVAILVARFISPNYHAILIILAMGTILGIIQSYILNGWYISRIYPAMKLPIFKNFLLIGLVLILISLFSYIINILFPFEGIVKFLLVTIIVSIMSFVSVFKFALTQEQRIYLYSLINFKR